MLARVEAALEVLRRDSRNLIELVRLQKLHEHPLTQRYRLQTSKRSLLVSRSFGNNDFEREITEEVSMTTKLFALGALVVLVAGCSSQSDTSTTSTSPTDTSAAMATTKPMAMAEKVTVVVKALNASGETGTATLTALDAKRTNVVVTLKGESATGDQPAHIHMGSCAKLNPAPKYLLKDIVGGKSTTIVAAPLEKITAAGMAINVHESAANLTKYVACGDIPK
jgi:hypothetical protein